MKFFALLILTLLSVHSDVPDPTLFDPQKLLPPQPSEAIERLLTEHQALTQERILLALLKSNREMELWTDIQKRAFDESQEEDVAKKESTLLITVFAEDREIHYHQGLGLKPTLSSERLDEIRKDLKNDLRAQDPGVALSRAILLILTELQSPLIASGRSEAIISDYGLEGAWQTSDQPHSRAWVWLSLLTGFFLLGGVGFLLTSTEVHYSSEGAYQQNPIIRLVRSFQRKLNVTAGGLHARW